MTRIANSLAIIKAAGVTVHCPACDAEQPGPNGGDETWSIEELRGAPLRMECVSCEHAFKVVVDHKVSLP